MASTASSSSDPDWNVRVSAFAALQALTSRHGPVLPWKVIEQGFTVAGRSLLFANQTKGIFRPAGMTGGALSIKTTVPRQGRPRYVDLAGDDVFSYALQDRGIEYHDNQLLLTCSRLATPFIYFFGIVPGQYRPIWPVYVQELSSDRGRAMIAAAPPDAIPIPGAHAADPIGKLIERRYTTVEVKRRLHQEAFRHLVLDAYADRCTVCGLPRRELLDAAHIVPDREARGEPSIPNGLSLCKLHHSAFDTNLIGIRPDLVVEVSRELLELSDGPTLEVALKGMSGRALALPRRKADHPSHEFLEERYELFRRGA